MESGILSEGTDLTENGMMIDGTERTGGRNVE
jgi:hypothetical protein